LERRLADCLRVLQNGTDTQISDRAETIFHALVEAADLCDQIGWKSAARRLRRSYWDDVDQPNCADLRALTISLLQSLACPADAPTAAPRAEKRSTNRKPGRPRAADAPRDKQLADAWNTKAYSTIEELANAFGVSQREARLSLERQRKRIARAVSADN